MKNTVVTVVCQYGSGGEQIARRLAEALSLPFYDSEALLDAAKEESREDGFRQGSEERGRRLYSLATGIGSATTGATALPEDDVTVIRLADAVKRLATEGGCVIAADGFAVAPVGQIKGISVYISADREDRVRRVSSGEGLLPSVAHRKILRRDKRNRRLCRLYAGASDRYALCLNSSFFGVDGAVEAIRGVLDRRNKCG